LLALPRLLIRHDLVHILIVFRTSRSVAHSRPVKAPTRTTTVTAILICRCVIKTSGSHRPE
jgi:hypothetical protein